MTLLTDWELDLRADHVLRGQGADPDVIRARRPRLVAVAEQALRDGLADLSPAVVYRELAAEGLRHETLDLEGGGRLRGPLIAQHLAGARRVIVAVCTVGESIDTKVHQAMETDPVLGLALDGLGSAATEALASAAASRFERQAAIDGMQATLPLSPGMVGWEVSEGQAQIFALVDPSPAGVVLTPNGMMTPRKSITFVLGIGPGLAGPARACDLCSLHETCRYQDHYSA
ncbi:MAG: hypothetical protein A2Y93_02085 [Chloroflexi bacterium RBG_13_68_17]|nr:MAG: hypothetical protein A2Y93_02085 [Chloroflexi bacterium RBG_13_68_17]